jgi:hypothetical protein
MAYEFYLGKTFTFHLFLCKMNIEDYTRKDEVMKKQIVSSIILIILTFILGLSNRVLATNQTIVNEDIPITNVVTNVPTQIQNNIEANVQTPWTNSAPTDYVNDISNQLQNIASGQQPKDMRRQVAIMVIIIVTVLLIVGLITWYYMTNQ